MMSKVQFWIAAPLDGIITYDETVIGNLVRGAANDDAGYNALALTREEAETVDPAIKEGPHTFFTITVEEVVDEAPLQ